MNSAILKEFDAQSIRLLVDGGYTADEIQKITKLSAFDVACYFSVLGLGNDEPDED